MNKSILKKLPTLLAILVMAGGVQTFTSCSSDDEGGGDPSSSSVGGGGGVSSSSGGGQGGGTSSGGGSIQPSSSSSSLAHIGKGNDISNYRTVVIGTQTWMAENLDYVVEGSKCYGNNPANCEKYGSLYNWSTAMGFASSCNESSCSSQIQSKHRGICPSGWHIPSEAEWDILMDYVGGSSTAGTKLKATSGWNENGNGTDEYGFSALPGGYGSSSGGFDIVGSYGYWWSATEDLAYGAYNRYMGYCNDDVYRDYINKSSLYSVRCVQD